MEPYWSETVNGHAPHSVKYESEAAVSSFPYCTESSLNFSASATTYSEDDAEYSTGRRNKTSRQDPLSHRIIEKRRRDRMNSCLADLSRLIPPQYQRKGRGRIEKTEIIEMAIRHLKHLQSECLQKESDYRMGYTDCMKEAAKFLYDSQMQDFCYRLLTRLQEHCDEVMKNDCLKSRNCHVLSDNVSASSGSPPQAYHHQPVAPLCQLRDMLAVSDMEQSNDHSDIKDLSFRNHLNGLQRNGLNGGACNANESSSNSNNSISNNNNSNAHNNAISAIATSNNAAGGCSSTTSSTSPLSNGSHKSDNSKTNRNGSSNNNNNNSNGHSNVSQQPNQAAVITSTAPASLHHHTDSSNHDFDSSREPLLQTDVSNMHSPPPRDATLLQHHHHHHHHLHQQGHSTESSMLLQSSRLRNFSESSHDVEHNSNNYKYKNHIKERFNHELHDEETTSEHYAAPPLLQSEHSHTHSMSEHSKDGTEPDVAPIIAKKRKLAEASQHAGSLPLDDADDAHLMPPVRSAASSTMLLGGGGGGGCDEKPTFCFSDIKTEPRCGPSHKLHFASLQHSSSGAAAAATTTITTPSSHRSSFAVPIFALHGQGTYYVPLNVDYSVLVPFLNGLDLLEKNYTSMPVVHPININVNFMPPTPTASLLVAAAAAAAVAAGKQQQPPAPSMSCNVSSAAAAAAAVAAAAATKAKLEAITNGW